MFFYDDTVRLYHQRRNIFQVYLKVPGTLCSAVEKLQGLDYPLPGIGGWAALSGFIQAKQWLAVLLVTDLWTAWAPCACAQLLDIRPDGTTALYKGPVIASPGEIKPLELFSATRPVGAAIANAAAHHGLSPALISAIAWQESHMRPDAVSPKGARGVMQLMPATARGLGVQAGELSANVEGGAAYLARLLDRYDGDIPKALAAYNAGPAAVDRYHGTPPYPETRSYVNAVLDRLAEMGPP